MGKLFEQQSKVAAAAQASALKNSCVLFFLSCIRVARLNRSQNTCNTCLLSAIKNVICQLIRCYLTIKFFHLPNCRE